MKKNTLYILCIICIVIFAVHVNYDQMKLWILNRMIVNRGILTPNCFWFRISDILLEDSSGIHLYNSLKEKKGDFPLTTQFDLPIYIVNNVHHIKQILDNSPTIFGVGKLKQDFFKPFMSKNVGVSQGCPWKHRRKINEVALDTDKLHQDASLYHTYIERYMELWKEKHIFTYEDFSGLGTYMATKIIFGVDKVHEDVFNVFSEAGSVTSLLQKDHKIDETIMNNYKKVLYHYIDHPRPNSLIQLSKSVSDNKIEIYHQIPHYIFPLAGLYVTSIPRLLLLLCNHTDVFGKVVQEINKHDVYHLPYLRKCIMETLRLMNPLITTFRTLLQDYTFDKTHSFKKGTQFLILNNPVLREKEFFDKPNMFIPERWTQEMESSYYAISFNQGPQRCPGKELVIFLMQSFMYHFVKLKNINHNTLIKTMDIDITNIPQMTNPCQTNFTFES